MTKEKNKETKTVKKKMVSALMSVCTALSKPKNDLDMHQWQKLEYREQSCPDRRGLM